MIRVQSSNGGNDVPYDEFILSISDTCLSIWKGETAMSPAQAAEQLATKVVDLHGNASKFSDNYFFSSDNTDNVGTISELIDRMNSERNLEGFIDNRTE